MRAGRLRTLVEVRRPVTAPLDAYGDAAGDGFQRVCFTYVSLVPQRATERLQAGQITISTPIKVATRYRPDINSQCYLFVPSSGRRLDIQSVINVAERNRELELVCIEHEGGDS
jgi:SPP1 family predicted phage head-tail adaptor